MEDTNPKGLGKYDWYIIRNEEKLISNIINAKEVESMHLSGDRQTTLVMKSGAQHVFAGSLPSEVFVDMGGVL